MKQFCRRQFIFFLVLLPSLTLGLWAQDSGPAEEAEKDPLPTTTHGMVVKENIPTIPESQKSLTKLPMALEKTPASVNVVEAPILRNQMAVNAGDAMRNIPGATGHTGFGVHDYFVIRGFGSLENGLVMVDGIADPEAPFYPVFNVERLEVLKGPTGFLYGANGLAGAINIVRKQPLFSDRLQLEATSGSHGFARTTVDFNHSDEDRFGFRLNGLFQDSDNYRDDKDSRQWGINPSLTWLVGEKGTLKVNLEWVENDHRTDIGIPLLSNAIPDVPRTQSYQSPFDRSDQQIARGTLTYEHRLSPQWTLRNQLFFTDYDWQSRGSLFLGAFPTPPAGDVLVFRNFTDLDNRETRVGNRFEAQTELVTGGITHQILMGFEVSKLDNDFTLDVAELPPIHLFNPIEFATVQPQPIPQFGQAGDASAETLAPYVLDRMILSPSLQLLVGLRLDSFDFEDSVLGINREDDEVSPFGGVVYSPNSAIHFYANYGEAFGPPSTLVTDPQRRPETGEQWEIGVKTITPDRRFSANFAYYDLEKGNIPISSTNFVLRQIGSQSSTGLEIELAAAFSDSWRGFLVAAYNDSELTNFNELMFVPTEDPSVFIPVVVDHSGNTSPFAPETTLNLWTTKEFASGWGFGGGLLFRDDQFIAPDNAFAIDSYTSLDGFASYKTGNWKFQANFKNLTDEEFESRGFGAQSVLPMAGFEALGSIQLTF